MAANVCCVSGGRVIITANGKKWTARTAAQIDYTDTERTVTANQDGSLAVSFKPMPPKATFSMSNECDFDLANLDNCNFDVTFDLIDARIKFFFTNAIRVGRPKLNTETGEISGIEITSQTCTYQRY